MKLKNTISAAAVFLLAVSCLPAQNRTRFAGRYNAIDFAYGLIGNSNPAALTLFSGNTSTGSASVTVNVAFTTLGDGTVIFPLNTNAPILVGTGTSQETVTPTALNNCNFSAGYGSCQITATFANTHGTGENVMSGSMGLQEAINAAQAAGGGIVDVNAPWKSFGGTTAMITGAAPFSNVFIEDNRIGEQYWSMQASTLTSLNAPTTLTSATVASASACPSGASCTWTATTVHACITLVDALGGEGPCSADYSFTATASVPVTFQAPLGTLTGAVGWRAYAGASYNAAYLLPVGTNCTVTTLEQVMPACAMSSTATFNAIYATTTTLRPNAQSPTVNLNLPMPQGHTTFAYQPTGRVPQLFQNHYGPFPAFGSTSSGQADVIGSVNLPTGYLNTITRSLRVYGKIAATVNTAAVPTVTLSLGWVGGTTAGAPVAVCTTTGAAYGSSAAFNLVFNCTLTTNATGASAGTIMTDGSLVYAPAAGGAGAATIDTGTAAIASLGLSPQNTLYVVYTSGTNTSSAVQLLDLHVEAIQ